jgi:hypothetical protein
MENAEGYYFSGTGNSLVQAKLVAERLGGGLIPLVRWESCTGVVAKSRGVGG